MRLPQCGRPAGAGDYGTSPDVLARPRTSRCFVTIAGVSSHPRILIVEDDPRIRSSLRLALSEEGYEVAEAVDAETALDLTRDDRPELLLVDVMLPGMNGLDLVRKVRRFASIPIIIVTARDDSHDVVAGLEAGADDYVTKPYNVKELAARIRSLLRRVEGLYDLDDDESITHGDLVVRVVEGTATLGGEDLDLTTTEFKLLCELASQPKRVLEREALLSSVWGYDYYGDVRVVDGHIARLRSKLERIDPTPYIHTVRGLGYKFEAG